MKKKIFFGIIFLMTIYLLYIYLVPRTQKETLEIAELELDYFMGFKSNRWLHNYKNKLHGPLRKSGGISEHYEWYAINSKGDTARITIIVSKKRVIIPTENNGYSIFYNDAWFE